MSLAANHGYKLTELGLFPADWEIRRLDEIANISSGGTPSRDNKKYWGGNVPWVTTALIDGNEIESAEEFITELGVKNSATKWFQKGSILIAMYGQGKTRGKVGLLGIDATINQACAGISLSEREAVPFIFHYLKSQYESIRRLSNSGGQENLSGSIIKSILVPMPRGDEQRAIAAALSDMDALISGLDQLIAKKRDIKQATMQQLLTGQTRLPGFSGEWNATRLSEVICEISDGGTPPTADQSNFGGDINWVVIDDIQSEIGSTRSTLTESGLRKCASRLWPVGTLILSTGATIGEVGILGVAAATKQGICGIRFHEELADIAFIKFWLLHNKNMLLAKAQGSSIKEIRAPTLIQLPINLPSLEEQKAIGSLLSDLDAELDSLVARRERAVQLKQGMMQELLTGRIRLV